jgi:opacity protein-like surface antigen
MKRVLSAPVALLALSTVGIAAAKAADVYPGPAPGPGPIQPSYPPVVAPYPPVVAPIPFCWTGFFVGGNLGFAWVNEDMVDSNGNTFSITNNAFIGGGQVGYNYQLGNLRPRTRLWSGCSSRAGADRFCARYDVDQVQRKTREAGLVPGEFRWPIAIHYWARRSPT